MSSWHSYPSTFALGHRAIADLLLDPVLVEEKVDGSQFSFGVFDQDGERVLRCRSKGAEIQTLAPEKMFAAAVATAQALSDRLITGWTYRGEYLAKPKHNALAYSRIPVGHVILFDINTAQEEYLAWDAKAEEAARLGLEVVPRLYEGVVADVQKIRELLDTVSILGGQKVEGVVLKNYQRFTAEKKVMVGKFVSEAFKEVHAAEWKAANPKSGDIVEMLIRQYRTPARWAKAVQHMREAGTLDQSPRDIGALFREVPEDIERDAADDIKAKLYEWAWPKIRRGVCAGLPEWYKERLLEQQFAQPEGGEASMTRECDACHEASDTVRARRTTDGEAGDLCRDCWADCQGAWGTMREEP